jgi:peptidoglycan/LPS O-acetylase OafA/YrhL
VLALPAAQGRTMSWRGYYPSRLLRLYVPTVAAVALAWLLVAAVPRHPHAGDSWWLAAHTSPVPLSEAAHDASLLLGSTWLNSALWSLKWEVLFSLLLPLFILLLVRPRRVWPWGLGVLAALVVGQASGHAVLVFMPMFGIGVLLARALPQLDESGRRFDQAVGLHRAAVVVLALVLLVSQWWLRPIVRGTAASTVGLVLTMLGASAIVWLFACTRTVSPVALSRAGQWLGLRSFSLYLVHEPIVVTSGYLLRGTWLADATLVVAVPLSLLAAELFGRLCEVPSHRLAQRVAARLRTADPAGSGLQSSPASTG